MVVYVINRVASRVLEGKSPYEVLFGVLLDLKQIKVFGSLCFAYTLSSHKSKFDPRSHKCVFLGYKPGVKGFDVYD